MENASLTVRHILNLAERQLTDQSANARAIGSVTIVLTCSVIDSEFTNIYLQENL